MGYSSYFLIVWDFGTVPGATKSWWVPGGARGPAAAWPYMPGITDIAPCHKLLFERFLNPERVSMPDFDIDFCYERPGRSSTMWWKNTAGSGWPRLSPSEPWPPGGGARCGTGPGLYGPPHCQTDSRSIEDDTIDKALEQEPSLAGNDARGPRGGKLITIAKKLEGLARHASTTTPPRGHCQGRP